MTEFKVGQKVKCLGYSSYAGEILHISDNVALVRYGYQHNRMHKLSELTSAEPAKPEPLKTGWYRLIGRATNFHYYVLEVAGRYLYTHAFNPLTGEMTGPTPGGFPIIIGSNVLNVARGDLIPVKFVDA